jgi:hypothetical protein
LFDRSVGRSLYSACVRPAGGGRPPVCSPPSAVAALVQESATRCPTPAASPASREPGSPRVPAPRRGGPGCPGDARHRRADRRHRARLRCGDPVRRAHGADPRDHPAPGRRRRPGARRPRLGSPCRARRRPLHRDRFRRRDHPLRGRAQPGAGAAAPRGARHPPPDHVGRARVARRRRARGVVLVRLGFAPVAALRITRRRHGADGRRAARARPPAAAEARDRARSRGGSRRPDRRRAGGAPPAVHARVGQRRRARRRHGAAVAGDGRDRDGGRRRPGDCPRAAPPVAGPRPRERAGRWRS